MPADDEGIKHGSLSPFQNVRTGLVCLALPKDANRTDEFLTSDDPALRAVVYASRSMSTDQIAAATERDGAMGLDEMVRIPSCGGGKSIEPSCVQPPRR